MRRRSTSTAASSLCVRRRRLRLIRCRACRVNTAAIACTCSAVAGSALPSASAREITQRPTKRSIRRSAIRFVQRLVVGDPLAEPAQRLVGGAREPRRVLLVVVRERAQRRRERMTDPVAPDAGRLREAPLGVVRHQAKALYRIIEDLADAPPERAPSGGPRRPSCRRARYRGAGYSFVPSKMGRLIRESRTTRSYGKCLM